MTTRARREARTASLIPVAVSAVVVALTVLGIVSALVGREIEHRADGSWHYEQLTLSHCTIGIRELRYQDTYFCTFQTVPPLPVEGSPILGVGSNGGAPSPVIRRWVHVVDGKVVGTDGRVSLWFLTLLVLPGVMVAVLIRSVRARRRDRSGRGRGRARPIGGAPLWGPFT